MLTIPISILAVRWIRYISFTVDEMKMFRLFARYWDGQTRHEQDAWKRVRKLMQEKSAHPKEIKYVEFQITRCHLENDQSVSQKSPQE